MSDIFSKADAIKLLLQRKVIFLGDSNIRGMYKDLLWLLNKNTLIGNQPLKSKLETSFLGDCLVKSSELNKGRDFQEVREYNHDGVHIEFYFLTKCYSKSVEELMAAVKGKMKAAPDLVVINSCLWDISRWGPDGVANYRDNLSKLMTLFKSSLPENTLVVWLTTLPIGSTCRGGFLIKQVEFLKHTLRFEVMEANIFAREIVVAHGFDVLDNHYYMRMQIHRRAGDGIHWLPVAVRHMTNLLLTHVALSWNKPLPGNFHGPSLERVKEGLGSLAVDEKVQLPDVQVMNTNKSCNAKSAKSKKKKKKNSVPSVVDNYCNGQQYHRQNLNPDILNAQRQQEWLLNIGNFVRSVSEQDNFVFGRQDFEFLTGINRYAFEEHLRYEEANCHRQSHGHGQNFGNIGPIKRRGQQNKSNRRPVPYRNQ